jgi:hypothetical protein
VIAEIGGRYVILKLRALRVLGEGDEQLFREVKEPLQLVLELFVSLEPLKSTRADAPAGRKRGGSVGMWKLS